MELRVPKLKGVPFEMAIIERYRRTEKPKEMKLGSSAKKPQDGIEEVLTYMDFLAHH